LGKAGYHHKNLKEEMIKNSIRIIGEEGYGKFSMRKVAGACGVSHAAPYRHFKDKDSLITAIFDQVNEKFDRILKSALEKHPSDTKDQLREMAFLYIKFFVENPEYMKFLFFSDFNKAIQEKTGAPNMVEISRPYHTFISTVERFRAAGGKDIRQIDQEAHILSLWGLAHGIAVLITQGNFRCEGDPLELVREIVWEGNCLP
jgi:AcrR family transcriptional regulator